MYVLIVEDDANKSAQLHSFVASISPDATIAVARSYQAALSQLVVRVPELVILDMSMPTFEVTQHESGGRPRPFGGRDIMREMARRGMSAPVVVVTQFESFGEGDEITTLSELKRELASAFKGLYFGFVFYHPAQLEWQGQLEILIKQIVNGSGK